MYFIDLNRAQCTYQCRVSAQIPYGDEMTPHFGHLFGHLLRVFHTKPSFYPLTVLRGARMLLLSGTARFSRSLYVADRVTQRSEVLVSIPFTAVLLNGSVSSVCSRGLYIDLVGKAVEKDSLTHKQICNWKQRASSHGPSAAAGEGGRCSKTESVLRLSTGLPLLCVSVVGKCERRY